MSDLTTCPSCGHDNAVGVRFCEACLTPIGPAPITPVDPTLPRDVADIVGGFFDDGDLLEASPVSMSRGQLTASAVGLPWLEGESGGDGAGLIRAPAGPLANLVARVEAALDGAGDRMVVLSGERGAGRTTILRAMRDKVHAERPTTRFIVVDGSGAERPWSLLERFMRLRFDIPDLLGGTIAGERFERAVEALFEDPLGADIARTCGRMLGFSFWNEHDIDFEDPQEQRRRALEALRTLLVRDLAATPTVLIFEDAGLADAESLEAVRSVRPRLAHASLAVLFSSDPRGLLRPTVLRDLPQIAIPPFDEPALTELADAALAGVGGVAASTRSSLVRHAGGKPGRLLALLEHAVELRLIVPTAGDDAAWQANDEGLAAALQAGTLREQDGGGLDGLSAETLKIATLASVFGERFWTGGVVALARAEAGRSDGENEKAAVEALEGEIDTALSELADRGTIAPSRGGLLQHEGPFRFTSTEDVDALQETHRDEDWTRRTRRAAIWLELVAGARRAELADTLAPLWVEAGDLRHAAWVYLRAADRALDALRPADAAERYEQARSLADEDAVGVHAQALIGLARVAERDGQHDKAVARLEDALGLTWRFHARALEATARHRLGRMHRNRGHLGIALEQLIPALELFEAVGDLAGTASCCDDIGRTYWLAGRMSEATRFLERAAAYRERVGDRQGLASTLANIAVLSMSRGEVARAETTIARAVSIRREGGRRAELVEAMNVQGAMYAMAGRLRDAVATMRDALVIAERIEHLRLASILKNNLGDALLTLGEIAEAEERLYAAVEAAGRLDDHTLLSDAARNLARAAHQRDDRERALIWARRSVAASQLADVIRTRASALQTLADILGDHEDFGASHDAYTRAEQIWQESGELREWRACRERHAAMLTRAGRGDEAQAVLASLEADGREPTRGE